MPYSHHSHSGSYCKHARDTLESVIKTAIDKKFKIFCLTEHAPRSLQKNIYPEEECLGFTPADLLTQFNNYVTVARKFQSEINAKDTGTKILVGFEIEGGIDDEHLAMYSKIRKEINADLIVGSVHHVRGVDIDFDQATWNVALENSGSLRKLYLEYFISVKTMLIQMKPEVVAHFDLIRLFAKIVVEDVEVSYEEHFNVEIQKDWPEVWNVITDCINFIVDNNLTVELNSAAIRKGWTSPYPRDDIMKIMVSKKVKFVLSDDSHGMDQVGLNYQYVLDYIMEMGVDIIWYYDINDGNVSLKSVTIEQLAKDPFWNNY